MLKTDLIQSIKALSKECQDPEKFKQLAAILKQKNIADTPLDYEKTHWLIFLMYLQWEDVRTNPNNTQLKAVGQRCQEQIAAHLNKNHPKI